MGVQIQPAVSVKLRKFKKRENMVPLILLVVLTVNNKLSFAAVALGKAEVHPDHPRQCFDVPSQKYYAIGTQWQMTDTCGVVSCDQMGIDALYLSYTTCPSISVGSPCILEEDANAPFPECCPRMKCPTFENLPDELNEIDHDDQMMMSSDDEPMIVSYDSTLDQDYYDEKDDSGFSNVFPLWRDFGRESSLGIDDEEKPNLFSPKK